MSGFLSLLITLAVGVVFGLGFLFLKIPNGLRIGALFGSALLSVFFGIAWMPSQTQFVVQTVAGALIGCTMEKSDIRRLPKVIKPMLITAGSFLFLNLSMGALIHTISPLNWVTALMSLVPGGMTDIPIIAADMGADTPKVALLQLARYLLGIAAFPPMILAYDNLRLKFQTPKSGAEICGASSAGTAARRLSRPNSPLALICTLAVGIAGGFVGYITNIPAGTFLFATVAVMVLKLKFDFANISVKVKKVVLVISGCYVGSLMTMDDVMSFRLLALPLVIVLGGYIINSFITGKILSKTCGFTRKEGMLITTPAGATDIALSSADLGVENSDIIIIHIFRSVLAMTVFPQIINVLLFVLP